MAVGGVISDQGSVIRTRHAFFGKKVPEGRMMVGLVVGALARWAFESVNMLWATAEYAPSAHFYPALCATLLQGSTHVGLD